MALTRESNFWFTAVDQDDSWGTDIRALLVTQPSANNTTICQHPNAAGTTEIQVDPLTTRTSTAADNSLGWAWNKLAASTDGMGAAAGARRVIPAGDWGFNQRIGLPNAGTVSGTLTAYVRFNVYHVSSTGVRTFYFAINGSTVQSTGLSGAVTGDSSATKTGVPEIVLGPNETIEVAMVTHLVQTAGSLGATVVGNVTIRLGDVNQALPSVMLPGAIAIRYDQAVTGRMVGVAPIVRKTMKIIPDAVMLGRASMVRKIKKPITARLDGVSVITRKIRKSLTARMVGVAPLIRKTMKIMPTAVMLGRASLSRRVKKLVVARLAGVATLARRNTIFRVLFARMGGVPVLTRKTKKPITAARMAGVAVLTKRARKPITARLAGIASLRRRTRKPITARLVGIAVLAKKPRKAMTARMAGVVSAIPKSTLRRVLSAVMIGRPRGAVILSFDALDAIGVSDYAVTTPTRFITGVVRYSDGSPYLEGDADVRLFRDGIDYKMQSTVSSAVDGSYEFVRDESDPYTYTVTAHRPRTEYATNPRLATVSTGYSVSEASGSSSTFTRDTTVAYISPASAKYVYIAKGTNGSYSRWHVTGASGTFGTGDVLTIEAIVKGPAGGYLKMAIREAAATVAAAPPALLTGDWQTVSFDHTVIGTAVAVDVYFNPTDSAGSTIGAGSQLGSYWIGRMSYSPADLPPIQAVTERGLAPHA